MNIADERLQELDDLTLTRNQRALLRCRLAAEFIHKGQYELAQQALGAFWHGIGKRPSLKGLSIAAQAEVLLQCGSLTGWLGSARQVHDAQDKARDFLVEAIRIFSSQRLTARVSEAQYELCMCHWRLGAFDKTRTTLKEAIANAGDNIDLKAKILIRRTMVEIWLGRYHDAWNILKEAQPFFENSNDAIKGRWHGQMGLVLRRLATAENRIDYSDRAIIEFTAAIYHYEQAGHERYCAINLNNLVMLLYKLGRFQEAHENLERAIRMIIRLKDDGLLTQVNETRVRVLIAEGRYEEAEKIITNVVITFEQGGESALLADALTIQGIALAKLEVYEKSISILRRAMKLAIDAGSPCNAAHAALTLIEEHAERLSVVELHKVYRRADELLKESQDAEDIARLRKCARVVTKRLYGPDVSSKNFKLSKAVRVYEERFIEQALELEGGSITRAARRLGIHHESLNYLLRKYHRNLLHKRKPVAQRKRGYVLREKPNKASCVAKKGVEAVNVLYVEDNAVVAEAVRETLEVEGWSVETRVNGAAGLEEIRSAKPYHLVIVDYDLPVMSGLELVREVRRLAHRQHIPIIMFSASHVRREALNAGADLFLRKPEDIRLLAESILRLLSERGR
ncbi:MAG: response regulator [Pyrinomonadaceae bacterium]